MSFATIRDQEMPVRLLRRMLQRKRVPHGLLFWGPSGVGKRLSAQVFAQAVNCARSVDDACGECLQCQKVAHGNHPDLHILGPAKKARIISVEAVESLVELASLRPFEGDSRVFIIQEADRMLGPAQNKFLKTLEEPLGNSVFILITAHPQFLLPTIRSRCQDLRFGALQPSTVSDLLVEQRELSAEAASAAAALSQGQMTRAFDLVDTEKRAVVMDVINRIHEGEDPLALSEEFSTYLKALKGQLEANTKVELSREERKELSKEDRQRMEEEQEALLVGLHRRAILEHLYLFETWYRDVLVHSATGQMDRVLNRDQTERLQEENGARPDEKLRAIDKARVYLERFLQEDRVFRDLFFALAD